MKQDSGNSWRGDPDSASFYSFHKGKLGERVEGEITHTDWAYVYGAIDLIRSVPIDKPLCIYLPLSYPHPPYAVEDEWFDQIDKTRLPRRIPMPEDDSLKPSMIRGLSRNLRLQGLDEEQWENLRATYYAMCARVDYQFGLLMDALKERGIYDETAVFMFSDHGDFTGDYDLVEKSQNTFEDCLTRVPFVIKPPKDVRLKSGISDALVELVDFPATVAEMADISLNYSHFGKSLLPLIAGETQEHRDAVFAEGGRRAGETHCMDVTEENVNPHFLYYPRASLHRSEGPEHTKATMCRTKRYKYVQRLYETDELYDLQKDPGEIQNVIHLAEYADVLAEMKDRLLYFYQDTNDVVPMERDQR